MLHPFAHSIGAAISILRLVATPMTSPAAAQGAPAGQKAPVVIINADATAAHQSVINVLEAARLAGFDRVTFAAQSSGKK